MNANPSYEVKFLLKDGKVLNSDHKLKDKYKTLFNINEELDMAMLYLDTKNTKLLNAQGWNVRVRKKETSSKTEFTFKKRYAVENNNLEAVLTAGSSNTGLIHALSKAAIARITTVIIEHTATATEEIASPSGVLGSFFVSFIAFTAQGSFKFIMLPVINVR